MNAPCPLTSSHGSGACLVTPPGVAKIGFDPGTGRSRSTPSTRKISPENASPRRAPTVSASSIAGLAYTPGTFCTRKIAVVEAASHAQHLQVDVVGDDVYARCERRDGGRVRQIHRQGDRHTKRHREHRGICCAICWRRYALQPSSRARNTGSRNDAAVVARRDRSHTAAASVLLGRQRGCSARRPAPAWRRKTFSPLCESRFPAGSRRRSGVLAADGSSRAIAARCSWPPDLRGNACAWSARPTPVNAGATRLA